MKIMKGGKKLMIGDNKGNITTVSHETGTLEHINIKHSQEVTEILYDEENQLIISSGWDSKILI